MGWYKIAQLLTPDQIKLYRMFRTPHGVTLKGTGLSASFQIPGTNQTLNGGQLMNQVISKIHKVLNENNVHTIDTSPVMNANAIGVSKSSEFGTIHVDIQKIFQQAQSQALPPTANLDGVQVDPDVSRDLIDKISQILTNELANTASHESKHNIDNYANFQKGKRFEANESGAESFGNQIANQYFKL